MDMLDRIRRLSWQIELAIVLGLAFGWTIYGSLRYLFASPTITRRSIPLITDASLWRIVLLELIVLALLVPLLYVRGWTLTRLGIRPSLWGCLIGGVLALIVYGMYFRLAVLVGHLWPEMHHTLDRTRVVGWGYSWTPIVLACVINPFYEELFVCGYVISVLTERCGRAMIGPTKIIANAEGEAMKLTSMIAARPPPPQVTSLATAVAISIAIRLSYHLYQGIQGVLTVLPIGLLFGIWFARTRQLWPLIVAHAIIDFVGLAARAG